MFSIRPLLILLILITASTLHGEEPGLLGRWTFDPQHVGKSTVKAAVGPLDAMISGNVRQELDPPAVYLDGSSSRMVLAEDFTSAALPREQITAEAWVAVEKPREWAAMICALQDNGNFEKGWGLGYRGSNFFFSLSSQGADDGDGVMTYLICPTAFTPGTWYHVVGTYDGKQMRIYLDGKLEASSPAQSGAINYPDHGWYELGAYHDDDEQYPAQGSLSEASVYDRVLSADEISARFTAGSKRLPQPAVLKTGPLVQHLAPDRVVVSWETNPAERSTLAYWAAGIPPQHVEETDPEMSHQVTLTGLKPNQPYRFQIAYRDPDGRKRLTSPYRFDTSCDLMPVDTASIPDQQDEPFAAAVRAIVSRSGVDRGYCLVLGCNDGRLALQLARQTNLQIICVEPDAAKVAATRRTLDQAGVYGVRVAVHHGSLEKLPYADHFANLIVSQSAMVDGELPPSVAEVCRVLRPCGGTAIFGHPNDEAALRAWLEKSPLDGGTVDRENGLWAVLRRGPLPGAGRWTQLYANAANSACSGDSLRGPLNIQWFGKPGPRQMTDRHHRGMASLVKDGYLVVPGNNRLKAVDAYNGTPLWDWTIPNFRRVGIARGSGHVVIGNGTVYAAVEGSCLEIDLATGSWQRTLKIPSSLSDVPSHWGYLAHAGHQLFGSAGAAGASYRGHDRQTIASYTYYDNVPMVTSRALFCLDDRTGQTLWTYRHADGSVILDSAIAIGEHHVYLLESRNADAVDDADGRVPLSVALAPSCSYLTALDRDTGNVVWQRPVDLSMLRHAVYLSYARETVLITGTHNQDKHPRYDLMAFDAGDGGPRWANHYLRTDRVVGGDHGEQDQHPVIVGKVIYSRPVAFDLETGARAEFTLDQAGGGCGTLSASASYLFGRGTNPQMYSIGANGGKATALTTITRPGCWINMIPAGGLLSIPESSSGCTCAFAVQTSIVFGQQSKNSP